jgi:hypothetical protein
MSTTIEMSIYIYIYAMVSYEVKKFFFLLHNLDRPIWTFVMSLNKWSFSFPARNWMSPFKPFDPFFLYFLPRPFYFPLHDFKIEAKKKINERELDLTEPHRRLARFTPSLEPHLAPLNTLVFPHQRLNFALCWSQRLLSSIPQGVVHHQQSLVILKGSWRSKRKYYLSLWQKKVEYRWMLVSLGMVTKVWARCPC